jgi:isopentenyl diphosphate isomerase/L-lactate dehydrogenase-like FMN-dependent dehydrogenase
VTDDDPTDADVVETAAAAAEGVVFERYRKSEVTDLDVTVAFEDGRLSVDVYLNPADGTDPDPDEVVAEAAEAAEAAVDDLFADERGS